MNIKNISLKLLQAFFILAFAHATAYAIVIIPAGSTVTDPVAQGYTLCTPGNCALSTTSASTSGIQNTQTVNFGDITSTGTVSSLNLSGTNSTLTNSTSTNLFASLLSALTAVFTNLTATNATLTNATTTNLSSTNSELTNSTITSATITNLYAPNFQVSSVNVSNGTITNSTSTNLFVTLFNAVSAIISTLTVGTVNVGTINATSSVNSLTLNASTTNASTTNSINFVGTNGTFTNATITNLGLTNGLSISSGGTGTTTAPAYGQFLVGNSNGGFDYYSTSTLAVATSSFASSTSIGATVTNAVDTGIFFLNNGVLTQDTANFSYDYATKKLTVTGGIDPLYFQAKDAATGTGAYYEAYNGASSSISVANTGRLRYNSNSQQWEVSTNGGAYTPIVVSGGNISWVDATGTNATITNIYSNGSFSLANGNIVGATITNLISTNSTITNSTSTSLFANLFNAVSAFISTITAGVINVGTINATTTISTLALNASTTNASTTNTINLSATGTSTLSTTSVANLSISDAAILASTTPSTTTNALYNINGNLYFNGTQLGVAGAGTEWSTINNSGIRLSTTSNSVVIGASATSTTDNFQVIGTAYINGTTTLATTTITNGAITNIEIAGGNATLTNATATFAQIYNLTAATTTLGTTTISTSSITNLNVLSTLWANILSVLNFTADNATITNATSSNIATTNFTATGSSVITNANVTNATITNATNTNFVSTNISNTNLTTVDATITNATSTNLFVTLFNSISAIISTITAGVINVGTINATTTINTLALNASTTNASTTNTIDLVSTGTSTFATTTQASSTISTANIGTANISNLNITGLTVPNATISFATVTNDLAVTNVNATGTITGVNGVFTNSTLTNATVTGNISGNTISATGNVNLSGTNTFATTTISTSSITNLNVLATLWANVLNVLGFEANNATITNATSTNIFATTASATNVFVGATTTSGALRLSDRNNNSIPWDIYEAVSSGLIFDYAGAQAGKLSASGIFTALLGLVSPNATITSATSSIIVTTNVTATGTATLANANITNATITNATTSGTHHHSGPITVGTFNSLNRQIIAANGQVTAAQFDVVSGDGTNFNFDLDLDGSADSPDPTIVLVKGQTYKFNVNASGHPFEIRTSAGGAAYNTGVTNNSTQSGIITFTVPMDAPDTLVYECVNHPGSMLGQIKLVGSSLTGTQGYTITFDANGNQVATSALAFDAAGNVTSAKNVTVTGSLTGATTTLGTTTISTSTITWLNVLTNLFAQLATIINLNSTNATITNATSSNIAVGNLTATGSTILATTSIATGSITDLTSTRASLANATISNATITNTVSVSNGITFATSTNSNYNTLYNDDGTLVWNKLANLPINTTGGYPWISQTAASANNWNSVAYGNGLFAAVSFNGSGDRVMTSPDGITWTSRASATDNNWKGITYGNGLFVAVAESGSGDRVMTSPDGITWTSRSSASDIFWNSVTYGNGLFVAVGYSGVGNRVMTSPDGITWTLRATPADYSWRTVTFGNGLFVAVALDGGTSSVMTSSDGITWTLRTTPNSNQWFGVTYGGGQFVAGAISGTNDRIMTSPDGINWTARTSPNGAYRSLIYANGVYVAADQSGADPFITSTDGINWTVRGTAASNWLGLAYGNNTFVSVGQSGSVATAPGGVINSNSTALKLTSGSLLISTSTLSGTEYGNALVIGAATSTTNVLTTTNALYNVNGSLYWNGSALTSGGSTATGTVGLIQFTDGAGNLLAATGFSYSTSSGVLANTGTSSFATTTIAAGSANLSEATITNATVTNISGTNANLTTITSTGTGTFATTTVASSSITNLNVLTQLYAALGTFLGLNVNGNLAVTGTSTLATTSITNLGVGTSTNIYGGELTAGLTLNNALVLASSTVLSTTTNALYNANGTLYFNGSAVASGGLPASTTSLYVGADGKVAIGTSTPSANFDVQGSIRNAQATTTATVVGTNGSVGATRGMAQKGQYLFSMWNSNSMKITDVSIPTSPSLITTFTLGTSSAYGIAVQNNFAYITHQFGAGPGSLSVVDISNVNAPVQVATTSITGFSGARTIALSGKYAYISGASNGIAIVDISNPYSPVFLSVFASGSQHYRIIAKDNLLYASSGNRLNIYSIINPTSPVLLGQTYAVTGALSGDVDVVGNMAYVTYQVINAVQVINVKNPASPVVMGTTTALANTPVAISATDRYAYVGLSGTSLVTTVDISSSTNPFVVANTTVSGGANEVGTLAISGKYLYSGNATALNVIDLGGADFDTARIGALQTGDLSVLADFFADAAAYIRGALSVGGNINTSGAIISTATNTASYIANALVLGNNTPATTTNALYNQGGTLSWSGNLATTPAAGGETWTARTAAEANIWYNVTYGNGLYVAVANSGTNRVMTSPDGITWTARAAAEANQWQSVVYGNGLFVAVSSGGTNRVMTSPDGITWTSRTAAAANQWRSVTYGNGLFVAVSSDGANRVMTSPDGITWTSQSASEANWWNTVTYGNGLFVAVSETGTNRVMTSSDGITWTARAAAETNSWFGVTYGNGLYVAVGYSGTNRVMTSPDGITWTARAASEANSWYGVTYGNGLFVAVAGSGTNRVMTSTDGITWTARSATEANTWQSVTFGNGLFVAVSQNGTNRVMTSTRTADYTSPFGFSVQNGGINISSQTVNGTTIGNVLTINSATATANIATTTNALYNVNGSLYFNGSAVGGSGALTLNNDGTITNSSTTAALIFGNQSSISTTSNALYNQGGTLYFNGSQLASGLSSLEVTFDSNISNGTAVQLYNDGTTIRARSVGVSGTGSAGNISTMSGGLVVDDSAALGAYSGSTVWVNDSTVVVGMRNSAGSVQKFRAATVSGVTPTFGTTLVSAHTGENNYLIPLPRSGSNRFIGLSNTQPNIGVFSVSGTTITEGTRDSLGFNAGSPGISGVETGVNEVAVIGSNGSTPVSINIVDISGTSISTISSNITVDSSPTAAPASYGNFDIAVVATTSATTTIAVSYTNGSNIYVRVGDVNSTTNTVEWGGSPVAIAATTQTVQKIARYADRKLAVMFYNSAGNAMQMQLVDISGANVPSTLGGVQTIGSITSVYQYPDLVNTTDNVLLAQFGASASNAVTQYLYNITVSGSSISATPNTLAASAKAYNSNGPLSVNPSGANFATTYAVDDTNYLPRIVLGVMSAGASDTRSQYFGVVSSSTVANATGTVALYGSVLSNVITNLVAGATYYIDSTGQLTTNVTNYVAGKALSSNQLSLNAALQPPASVSSGSTNVAASYFRATLATNQNTDLSSGNHVKWDTVANNYGSDISLDTTTTYTSTSNANSIGRFTLKAGKTYRLVGNVSIDSTGSYNELAWFNADTGTKISGGTSITAIEVAATGIGSNPTGPATAIFTPSVDTRVELRITSNSSVSNIRSSTGSFSNTYADIEVIAGNAAVTGQSVDYINANITSVQSVANGAAIPFVTTSGNIANSSGVFTLSAGKTYRLTGGIAYDQTNGASGSSWRWRDITNNTLLGSSAFANSSQQAVNEGSQPIAEAVITPTTNITVRLENIGGSTKSVAASSGSNGGTWATIQQLGSSATTEYSNNILSNFTASTTIMSGTLSEYINHIQIAQASTSLTLSIPSPANTSLSRIVYIDNTGTANFDMHGVTVGAGETVAFKWNGTTWKSFGNQAANVAAEYGTQSITNGATFATSLGDIAGSTFTLPTAGTWQVTYNVFGSSGSVDNVSIGVYDTSNVLVAGSQTTAREDVASSNMVLGNQVIVTTTSASTYKLRGVTQNGTFTIINTGSGTNSAANSNITFTKISGYLPVIGQTVDYVYAESSGTVATANTDIPLTVLSGNIPVSGAQITLTAGKTYELSATFFGNSTFAEYFFTDNSNTRLSNIGVSGSFSSTDNGSSVSPVLVITPTVNTVVKLRTGTVSGLSGGASQNYTRVTVKQLGSTAITGVTWSSLIAPIANLTTNMSTYATNLSWTATTSSTTVSDVASTTGLFNFTANSLAIGNLLNIDTSSASSSALAVRIKGSIAKVFGTDYATSTAYANNVDFGNTSRIRVKATSTSFIGVTGIANGQDGEELTIVNASSTKSFTIYNQSASSTAANRIITGTGADLTIAGDATILLAYDFADQRWRVVGGSGGGTSVSSTNLTNFTASSTVGTAAATVDTYTNLNIAQASSSVVLTLPSPTVTTAGKTITVNNTGTASFEMYDVEVPSSGSAIFIWNGTFWSSIEGKGNVAAEYGSASIAASAFTGSTGGMSTYADVTGGSITVPSAGTWRIHSTGAAQLGSSDEIRVAITDTSNNIQGNSVYYTGGGSTINASVNVEAVVTTTGAQTFKLRAAAATALVYPYQDAATIWYEKISGNAAVTGQTVDYVQAGFTANQVVSSAQVAAGQDVIFTTVQAGNIPLNTSTGVFTLTAGKTYKLDASFRVGAYGGSTDSVDFKWVDANSNAVLSTTVAGNDIPITHNANYDFINRTEAIYTPSTNQTVKVRITSGSVTTSATIFASSSVATVQQLGSNATTEYSNNALADFTASSTITATLSEYVNHYQILQTTPAITLTIPNPTNTSLSRIIYIDNTGTANFQMHDVTVGAGETVAFKWNGTTWKSFGNQAANVAAEYGINTTITDGQTTTSTSYSDVTGGSFTIPSAGTWQVIYNVVGSNSTAGSGGNFRIVDNSGNEVTNTYTRAGSAAGGSRFSVTNTVFITTTGSATYQLQRAVQNSGTLTVYNDGTVGGERASSNITWEKISGYLPVTGQIVDYLEAIKTGSQATTAGTDMTFVTQNGNISFDGTSITLEAGKTYELIGSLRIASFTGGSGSATYSWVDSSNNSLSGSTNGTVIADGANNGTTQAIARVIYTPSSTQTVKLRVTAANTNTGATTGSYITVKQIGSSAMTSESLLSNGGQLSGINATIGTLGNNFFRIIASSTEYMRVLATGQGLIGTTTINTTVGTSTLAIVGTTTNGTANVFSIASSTGNSLFLVNNGGSVLMGTSSIAGFSGNTMLYAESDVNSASNFIIANKNQGTGAFTGFDIRNGTTTLDGFTFAIAGQNFTPTGLYNSDAAVLSARANLSNGLTIGSESATAGLKFFTGGSTASNVRMTIDESGAFTFGTTTPNGSYNMQAISTSSPILSIASSTGANVFTVNANGNVSIGSVLPTARLDVTSALSGSPALILRNGIGANVFEIRAGTSTSNISIGVNALRLNNNGTDNTAVGAYALEANVDGNYNTAYGKNTLILNANGSYNTALGNIALAGLTSGSYVTALGDSAGRYIQDGNDNASSSLSLFLGYNTRASASGNQNEIVIGANAVGNGSNTLTLGSTSLLSTIINSQKVGIGTTTPTHQLSIARNANGNYLYVGNPTNTAENRVLIENGWSGSDNYSLRIQRNSSNPVFTINGDGNVGIGTSTPGTSLHIAKIAGANSSGLELLRLSASYDGGGTAGAGGYLSFTDENNIEVNRIRSHNESNGNVALTFSTMNSAAMSEKMRIAGSGQVSIGTTTSSGMLYVKSNSVTTWQTATLEGSTTGDQTVGLRLVNGSTTAQRAWHIAVGGDSNGVGAEDGDFYIRDESNGANRLFIDRSTGNIGVGTSTPTTLLTLASSTGSASLLVSASGTDAAAVFNNTGANTSYYIGAGATSSGIGNGNFGIFDLKNSAARLVVGSSGLVGIGTSTPDATLSLGGTNTGLSMKDDASGDRAWLTRFTDRLHISSTDEVRLMGGASNGTDGSGLVVESGGHVRPSGNNTLTLGTGSFRWTEVFATNGVINTSDARLKENVLDLANESGLDTVLALRPVTYNWIDKGAGSQKNFGFLAQEVYSINPELVTGTTTGSSTLGINYTNFIPLLTKAVQQLNAKIFSSSAQQAISIEEITASSTISVDDKIKALGMNAKQVNDMLAQLASSTSATSTVTTTETVTTSTSTAVCAVDTQVGTSMNGGVVTEVTSTTTPIIVEGQIPQTITNCLITTYSTSTTVTEDLTFVGKLLARVVEVVKDLLANVGVDLIKSKEVKTDRVCIFDPATSSDVCLDLETLKAIKAQTSGGNVGGNNTPNPAPTPTPEPEPENGGSVESSNSVNSENEETGNTQENTNSENSGDTTQDGASSDTAVDSQNGSDSAPL